MEDNVKAAISGMLGASIAVVWIWFALLGVQTLGAQMSLFIALALTILFGTLAGVIWIPKTGKGY